MVDGLLAATVCPCAFDNRRVTEIRNEGTRNNLPILMAQLKSYRFHKFGPLTVNKKPQGHWLPTFWMQKTTFWMQKTTFGCLVFEMAAVPLPLLFGDSIHGNSLA